ncbi:hypothetical protein ACFL38_02145 [Candidatus Omnitrophota bacterium]
MINKKDKMRKSKCPGIETIACYVDGILSQKERESIEYHAEICQKCKEEIACQMEVATLQKKEGLSFVPSFSTEGAKNLVHEEVGVNILELVVSFTDKAIEVVRTTGDILLGGQLQPAYALRGNKIEPASTQSIVKIFDNIRVEVEVTRQKDEFNKIILITQDNQTKTPINDLRATLIQEDIELESYIMRNGKAIFESIRPGHYIMRISDVEKPLGIIALEFSQT